MNPLASLDYEWFCVDSQDNIACMITAGDGPLPQSAFRNKDVNDRFAEFVKKLPPRGGYVIQARDVFEKSGTTSKFVETGLSPIPDNEFNRQRLRDFIHLAERGIFAYDWVDVHRPGYACSRKYEQIAKPKVPLKLADIPEEFASFVETTRISEVKFQDQVAIDVKNHFDCLD